MDSLARDKAETVTTSLNYLQPMAGRPVSYTFEPPPGTPWRTGEYRPTSVAIRDGRARAGGSSLDENGFLLAHRPSVVADFYDEEAVRALYYPEVERLVGELTGADKVVAFDHNLRSSAVPPGGADGIKEPVKRVHNDFTELSGPRRAAEELAARGLEAGELLKRRFALVNLWRPIRGPVEDSPLAVCEAKSIAPRDLVAADLVYRDRVGETYSITYNPAHRWFYFPHMTREEALLIKCFDSAVDGRTRFTAHSSFE
ncbi:MAG TPA: CmcJ/NvfI family oxidoreductase, partial [Alphaproteobacteria bacterium]|nr:CmcJ/NvfI family oxidoreductase [Alphaproteobacteria bacterium]